MRNSRSALLLLVAMLAIAAMLWSRSPNIINTINASMARHGLTAANIAYGRAGEEPKLISINAPNGLIRPYYSLAKPITAATALRLLNLDQKIAGATVRQILQHSGGWDRDIAGDPVTQRKQNNDCTTLSPPDKQFRPGDHYAYSNIGYCLIGHAIEEKSGKSYRETVNVLFPETRAMQYDPWLGPAGGWSGTVKDYFRFASRQPLAQTGQNPLSRPNDIPYGLGWAIGPDFITHFGAFRSNFSLVVRQGDFVAVAVFNGRPPDDAKAARELRSALMRLNETKVKR